MSTKATLHCSLNAFWFARLRADQGQRRRRVGHPRKFLPYFAPTMDKLKHFLILSGEGEETELRGIAMNAVGTFAEAVGKEALCRRRRPP